MEHKKGGSSHVANTESQMTENSANTESRAIKNSGNMESRVTENSVNTKNWVIQDLGGKKLEEGKCAVPSKRPAPRWCPRGITKTKNADCKRCIKESWPRKKD
jgi:hypothetical protein